MEIEDNFPEQEEGGPEIKNRIEEIITEKFSLLLDRCRISHREAVQIISATAEA